MRYISTYILFILSFSGIAQTVTLAVDKTTIAEGDSAIITATLSTASTAETIVSFIPTGDAVFDTDYEFNYIGKGTVTTVAGGNGSGNAANQLNFDVWYFAGARGASKSAVGVTRPWEVPSTTSPTLGPSP